MDESEQAHKRPDARQFAALVVITAATSVALGITLRQPTLMGANDISRWCTVWSLLERGSYIIDECPWQLETQDKVYRAPKHGGTVDPGAVKHYYSSKPALLPTLIAGILYPARQVTGVPLDLIVLEPRAPRWIQKADPDSPGKAKGVLETPTDPVKWPAYIFYFKPILILLNVIPFAIFLIFFARLLDQYAAAEWPWFLGLVSAAFATYLLPYSQTLNNHTVAAYSAFFALYQFVQIWDRGQRAGWRFAMAGFFAAFTAANELPALAFLALLGGLLLIREPRRTLLFFVPGALIPVAGFAAAQYAVFGEFKIAYESFGTDEYLYEGSLWKTPLDLDALNDDPEPHGLYLFHLTLGHHGIFSLSPIFLFSALGAVQLLAGQGKLITIWTWLTVLVVAGLGGSYVYNPAAWSAGGSLHAYVWVFLAIPGMVGVLAFLGGYGLVKDGGKPLAAVAWLTTVLTLVILAFYTWNPKARNYGGMAQGLRWLFWLIPFWLVLLIKGAEAGQARPWARAAMLVALGISVISVGYAMRNPWSHPWLLDALEHLKLYHLKR